MKDVSQYLEYTFLKDYIKKPKNKSVVDVGSKGLTCSNSYNFIMDDGWEGLLIEPEKNNFKTLLDLYKGVDRVKLLNIAVADTAGYLPLYIKPLAGHHSLVRGRGNIKVEYVRVFHLPYILRLNKIPKDFDLLSVDAEGMDFRIVKYMLEKSFYRPGIIIVEKEHGNNPFNVLFKKFNYSLIYTTKGNFIYEKQKV